MLIHGGATKAVSSFADDVREGLGRSGQKQLPWKYFYDEIGSSLFELITELPEYGLTRAEDRILERHSGAIAARLATHSIVVELGSGCGRKTRRVLEAIARHRAVTYSPIEISPAALEKCQSALADLGRVNTRGIQADYLDGLAQALSRRERGEGVLVLFLGSSIGNFDRWQGGDFLRRIREELNPGDALLLGTDLEKPLTQLIPAYDDALGVTAEFNRNLLARINRELGGDFNLSRFEHVALYNTAERRIEMHLRSLEAQTVTIQGEPFAFERDETIWTESSHKFYRDEAQEIAARTGFESSAQWVDDEWGFAEDLLFAI